MDKQQQIQEDCYKFPYHYIPRFENGNYSQSIVVRWGYEYISYIYFVINRLNELNFDSLIDVGCGDGKLLNEIYNKYPQKLLFGIDYSKRAIKYAILMNPNLRYICGDILEGKFIKNQFNVVTLIEVLEHIYPYYIDNFIKALYNLTKTQGSLIITVPTKNIETHEKHYQHFNVDNLIELFEPYYKISEIKFINKISKIELWLNRLLANRFFITNEPFLVNNIYKFYEKYLFNAEEHNCKRIYAHFNKNV